MTLFEEIVSEILTEDVPIGKINDAIARTYEVKINYQSEDDNASGERIIQPVAYGLTKAGKPAIRAYQPFGDTQTSVPAWKLFLLSGIINWKPMFKRVFLTPPDGFNSNDDRGMSTVYKIAHFSKQIEKQPTPVKSNGPVKKTDTIPQHISVKDNPEVKKLEKLRKQLDNPKYISDIIKNKNFKQDTNNQNQKLTANSGPIEKNDIKDDNYISVKDSPEYKNLENLKQQLETPKYVSDDVLKQWEKEKDKRKYNKYGNNNK